MTRIELQNLAKHYGATRAVDGVSLAIETGDLFFLLGPSGCGKTTLLRMIAGFIEPTGGAIRFDGRDVTNLPANKRNTGMVFQSYALWPHMSVGENVAYGLKVRKVDTTERRARVLEALTAVQMDAYIDRKPNQLSGGQQQRVALARALVVKPSVLLLDEPLSNLDAKLRLEMRTEIRRICKASGITTVYVTHDQKEALSMADRIAVLQAGLVVQVGPPRELYQKPVSSFVADFLGETNFLPATVRAAGNGTLELDTPAGRLVSRTDVTAKPGDRVTCSLRPEALRVWDGEDGNRLPGTRTDSIYLGEMAQHIVELDGSVIVRALETNPHATPPDRMELRVAPEDVVVLAEAPRTI